MDKGKGRYDMEVKVTLTLKQVNDLIYLFQRQANTYSNPESKKVAKDAAEALNAYFNLKLQHGQPINSIMTVTDSYCQE